MFEDEDSKRRKIAKTPSMEKSLMESPLYLRSHWSSMAAGEGRVSAQLCPSKRLPVF